MAKSVFDPADDTDRDTKRRGGSAKKVAGDGAYIDDCQGPRFPGEVVTNCTESTALPEIIRAAR